MSCSSDRPAVAGASRFSASERDIAVGGRKVVTLSLSEPDQKDRPQFVGADVLPGRGMNIYQIRAYFPGKGIIDVLASPPVEQAPQILNLGAGDEYGNASYRFGAILLPFANRIRGKLLPDGKMLETTIMGKKYQLPANNRGRKPGVEPHAMHGLILARPTNQLSTKADAQEATVTGVIEAGDFEGHWPSKTNVTVSVSLTKNAFGFAVTAKNVGTEDLPMGIGWHPFFAFPSGDRTQARLKIPGRERAIVNNYDEVFPTGETVPVAGTPYDFSGPEGAPLGKLFLDDCFIEVQKDSQGHSIAEIRDPAAKYGLRFRSMSPEISAYQVYAPPERSVVAFEPQFNWADPFSPIWKGKDTKMAMLKPGQSVTYRLEIEPFIP